MKSLGASLRSPRLCVEKATTGTGENAPHMAHRYLYGQAADAILASDNGTAVLWGLGDHEGTIRDIVNNSGTVVDHRKYDSFGKMTSESAPATDFIFGYTGQALDKDTGLIDFGHRPYDPAVARFPNEDPSGFSAGDMNLYRYVGNNPLNNTDPSGLCNRSTSQGMFDQQTLNSWSAGIRNPGPMAPTFAQNAQPGSVAGAFFDTFMSTLFVDEIYGGTKALVTGEAGQALGNRAVGIVQTQTGTPFAGTASDWARFGRGVAGDIVGVNSVVEAGYGYDISNQQQLDAWQRSQRGAAGISALAGTAAGGITAAARYPTVFPAAARAAGVATTESGLVIDRYGTLSQSSIPGQTHHLNQAAAYGEIIPYQEGMAIKLEGNILSDVGAPHTLAHESLENFWYQYRGTDMVPTNLQYTRALQESLRVSGLPETQVQQAVRAAIRERVQYGALGGMDVPNVPKPIPNLAR